MKKNFFSVNSSILISSQSIPFCNNSVRFSSTFSTAKAKCLKPQLSGQEGLFGGFGKENNSIT